MRARCLFLVQVFINVSFQSVLVVNLEEYEMSMCPSIKSSFIEIIFLFACSRSDVTGKNSSFRSKQLPTLACWSREKREERCEANQFCV